MRWFSLVSSKGNFSGKLTHLFVDLWIRRSLPASEFGQSKGRLPIPTGVDGGTLNIYSHNEFKLRRDGVEEPRPPVRSLDGSLGMRHLHPPVRPVPYSKGGVLDMPAVEITPVVNATYQPGQKFAAPARNAHQMSPELGLYREACQFNLERKKDLLTQVHPLVKGNGDIVGHEGVEGVNKPVVNKVGVETFGEKQYIRNMRKQEAVKRWALRKHKDGHHMKNLLSQEYIGDNRLQYSVGRRR